MPRIRKKLRRNELTGWRVSGLASGILVGLVTLLLLARESNTGSSSRNTSIALLELQQQPLLTLAQMGSHSSQRNDIDSINTMATTVTASTICKENPYRTSLSPGHSFESTKHKAQTWLSNQTAIYHDIQARSDGRHNHIRFDAFEVMAPCNYTCTGSCRHDTSKIVCGIETLQPGCMIYSIGGNNDWTFEEYMYDKTPCEIHTFDCTGPKERFEIPSRITDRHQFHHVCLSTENRSPVEHPELVQHGKRVYGVIGEMNTLQTIQKKLGHSRLDLLKIDIEGFEWPIFECWSELSSSSSSSSGIATPTQSSSLANDYGVGVGVALPMQILVEVHYRTHVQGLWTTRGVDWKNEQDIINFQAHLLRMGYAVAVRDDNQMCRHCTELTLLRYDCSSS